MKSFMSAALNEPAPTSSIKPSTGTECSSCNQGVTTTGGVESTDQASQPAADAAKPTGDKENAVVVMQGPLGTAITEALNKSLSKRSLAAPVQVPQIGNESITTQYVQANGQINNAPGMLARISKSVGLLPATDNEPTVVNTMIDAASKVEDIDFVVVESVDGDPSQSIMDQKRHIHVVGVDGNPAMETIAVESVQLVVRVRRLPKG